MKIKSKSKLVKAGVKLGGSVTGNKAEASSAKSGGMGWLTQGSDAVRAQFERTKVSATSFAPEFFLRDGDSRTVRFRCSEPLGTFGRYSLRKDGRWHSFTAPASGDRDRFREAGLKPSQKFLYELIDVEGYVSKKDGKHHKNQPKFFLANMRQYEQLEMIRKKLGSLTAFNIEIACSGSKQQKTLMFMPEAPRPFNGLDKIPSLKKDIAKYYAPPSDSTQRSVLEGFDPADNESES